jgi:D-proline reductase (dithiol) PrdB
VTTAGLKPGGELGLWHYTDASFMVLDGDARDLRLAHVSPNFDRSGFAEDLNVVYPVDRLSELVADGTIGSLNHRHLSFMGGLTEFSTIIHDSGPTAAQLLVDDGVDVVIFTPV